MEKMTSVFKMVSPEEPGPGTGTNESSFVDIKLDMEPEDGEKNRTSVFCQKCCVCFNSIMMHKNPLPQNPTICQRIRYAFMCPPHGIIGSYFTAVFIFAILYAVLWSLFGDYALPHNAIFELWLHFVTSIIGGYIIHLISLPPLLGMLLMAIVVHIFPHKNIDNTVSFVIRFVIAAVSPAIVMPCLLHFQELGYGVDKGIPTLLIAASSIDDVLAITGFGVIMGIAFAEGNIVWAFFKGPLEALLGVLLGAIFGVILWYIPAVEEEKRIFLKGFILFSVGLMGILGCPRLEIPGTGPLLCLTVAFVAAAGWRRQNDQKCLKTLIMKFMSILWFIFQPLLFGLIGAQMNIHKLSSKSISYGIVTLIISLSFRSLVAFAAVFGTNMIMKEKFFVAMAWIPKATVQAAIGSLALSTAQEKHKPEFEKYGLII